MKNIFLSLLFIQLFSLSAHAQWQKANWWALDYIHNQFKYTEPGAMSESGNLPGLRLEMGVSLSNWLSLSVNGQYVSGNLTYEGATFGGTPVTTITKDRVWHTGAKINFVSDPIYFSVGWAKRYLYNDLVISYRREQTYNYMPVAISYNAAPFYFTYEHRVFLDGTNTSHMSDVGPTHRDVTFTQKTGKGYALETGYLIPASPIQTKISIRYESWDVEQSDVQNDNVDNLVEPKNNTQELILGIGIIF